MARAHWGQGLMKEVTNAVLDEAFSVVALRRVEACAY